MKSLGFYERIKIFFINVFLMPIRIKKISSVMHTNKDGVQKISKDVINTNKEITDIHKEILNMSVEIARLREEITKANKNLSPERNTILANRRDGLGQRLLAILNSIAVSDFFKYDFKFTWDVGLEKDKHHAISSVDKIFSENFIKNNFHPKLVDNIPHVRDMKDSANNGKWFECTQSINAAFAKKYNLSLNYKKAFEKIEFSEHILKAKLAAQEIEVDESTVAIQMRAGDIIYGEFRHHTSFYSKVILYPIVLEAIGNFLNVNKKIIIFGQDEGLINKIVEFFEGENIFSSKMLMEGFDFDNEQVAFFDIFLMSRCKHIYAKESGFALISAKIADKSLESFGMKSNEEKDFIFKNIDLLEVSKEQYSYSILGVVYHTNIYDFEDAKNTLDLVKKGLLKDNYNIGLHFYVLIYNILYCDEAYGYEYLTALLPTHKERLLKFFRTFNSTVNKYNYKKNKYLQVIDDGFDLGNRVAIFSKYYINFRDVNAQKEILAENSFLLG